MTVFNSRALSKLKEDLVFLRASQKLTADNIAQSNTPNAVPQKLERTTFRSALNLAQPNNGTGFSATNAYSGQFRSVDDTENQTESTPGESRISIENESIKMAELDTQHNLGIRTFNAWKKAVKIAIGSGG